MEAFEQGTPPSGYMEGLRQWKSHLLKQDTFTARELETLAKQAGYSFVGGQMLRDWTRHSVFPSAPIPASRQGGRFTPGQWTREDVVRLLDTCWLHEQNCRGRALQLGLWLLSYSPLDGANPRELLSEQIERMEEVLFRRVLPGDMGAISDEEHEGLAQSAKQAVMQPGRFLLDELCAGLDVQGMRTLGGPGDSFYDYIARRPGAYTSATQKDMARFPALVHVDDEEDAPVPAIWAAMSPYLEERMRRLNQLLELKRPPAPNAAAQIIQATHPHGDNIPASTLKDGELTALQRDLLTAHLWGTSGLLFGAGEFTLPCLRGVLADATDEEIALARNAIARLVLGICQEHRAYPAPKLSGLTWFMEQAGSDVRRLFAAPAFFPLVAYLVAVHLHAMRHPGQVFVRRSLVPVALDQLARLTRESTSRAEAFLSVIFTAIPVVREEVQ